MLKEYAIYYTLTSANGSAVCHGVVVKTLKEVEEYKRRIREAGYELNGIKWRGRKSDNRRALNEGWMAV